MTFKCKRVTTCVLSLFCFFMLNNCLAQQTDSIAKQNFGKQFTSTFLRESGNLVYNLGQQATSPARIKLKQVPYLVLGAATLSSFIYFDRDIYKNTSPLYSNVDLRYGSTILSEMAGNYGNAAMLVYGTVSWISKNPKMRNDFWHCTQAMITSAVWTRLIKISAGKERPEYYYQLPLQHKLWHGFNLTNSDFHSFSSGHTANAFAIATVFATHYKNKIAVPIIAYTLAAAVGCSRMVLQKHWSSDVFAGACIGFLCAKQVTIGNRKKHKRA